jgi:hypothetical protein
MIEIWTEQLSGDWIWSPHNYVSGTVEFYVNTAEQMAKFEDVFVYYDGEPCEKNQVYYVPRSQYKGLDVLLTCNSKAPKLARYNIAWCNWFGKKDTEYLEYDERITQSLYHQSVFGKNSRIVDLGIDNIGYNGRNKKRKQCLYSSSPDRGLDFLHSIWNDVSRETGAELVSTYKKSISEEDMVTLYNESEFWLHPGQGIELFCIAAAKAQLAKCIPVVIPNMALAETVKYGVKTTKENYKDDLIKAIRNPPLVEDVNFKTWEEVTKELFCNI